MKIEIEIPDFPEDEYKDVFIIKGTEQRAYYDHIEKKWHIKTSRCVQCGKCCRDLPKGQYLRKENKDCLFLTDVSEKVHPCALGPVRPWPCIEGDPVKGKWGKDFCSIRYDGEK